METLYLLAGSKISRRDNTVRITPKDGKARNFPVESLKHIIVAGTSQFNRDAWFAGFTGDNITTVVWVGPPENETMRGVAGGGLPAKIFARFNLSLRDRFAAYDKGEELPR